MNTISAQEMLDMLHGRRPFPADDDAFDYPAEAWCERCDQPTAEVVVVQSGPHHLCADHAFALRYKTTSPAWNTSAGRR